MLFFVKFKDLSHNFFYLFFFISQSVFAQMGWKLYQKLTKNQGYTMTNSV